MKSELSNLMDGALEGPDRERVLNALQRDPELRKDWDTYCGLGDYLRRSYPVRSDFCTRVMHSLESEPTVLAAQPVAKSRSRAGWLMPLAASVAGAAVVAWLAQGPGGGAPSVAVAPPQAAPQVARVETSPAPVAVVPQALPQDGQVTPYLFVHQGYSPSGSIHGVAQYVRVVTETRQEPGR